MQAFILAGGAGTRLRSVVSDVPKPMATVSGRPFLTYQLDFLKTQGITSVILSTGYKADVIESYFRSHPQSDLQLSFSREQVPLGTGGALRLALKHFKEEKVIVLNGDTWFPCSLKELHQQTQAQQCRIALRQEPSRGRYGSVVLDQKGQIQSFGQDSGATGSAPEDKADGPVWINAGVYCLDVALIKALPEGRSSLEAEAFPRWAEKGQLWGMPSHVPFIDIGIPEDYQRAHEVILPKV